MGICEETERAGDEIEETMSMLPDNKCSLELHSIVVSRSVVVNSGASRAICGMRLLQECERPSCLILLNTRFWNDQIEKQLKKFYRESV